MGQIADHQRFLRSSASGSAIEYVRKQRRGLDERILEAVAIFQGSYARVSCPQAEAEGYAVHAFHYVFQKIGVGK